MNSSQGNTKADILIVDDTPENLRILSVFLSKQGYTVRNALSGKMALTAVQTVLPDLILLDLMMPEMSGYEVCHRLKADPQTAQIPIIILSALYEAFDKVEAFGLGVADYVTKPFSLEEVLARVRNQLMIRMAEQRIQQLNAELEARVKDRTLQLEIVNQNLTREIQERQQLQAQLLEMALHDALTGLPNRTLFMERLQQALNRVHTETNYQIALLFLDCDRFKVINDSLGHLVGDELLMAIARRLQTILQPGTTLARLGGDEFAILMQNIESPKEAIHLAEQLLQTMTLPFQLERHEVFINGSIGIALSNATYEKPEHLLRDADTAMYRAKALGKAQYQVFDAEMHEAAFQLLQLETDLRRALQHQEFTVYYQPIVALDTGMLTGFEALLRWHHPQRGLIPPAEFIPVAEDSGLIAPIGTWVLQEACQQLCQWQRECLLDYPLVMSINLSVRQFAQPDLVDHIDQVLEATQLDPHYLKLEITESAIMDNAQWAASILQQLRQRHIQLSIDDFGTGYSSLSYLHSFPVDTLKIDRSFICHLNDTLDHARLVPLIVNIAHAMNMTVVAEGIETEQQLNHLKQLNCDFGQGYFLSKPLPADKAACLMACHQQYPRHFF